LWERVQSWYGMSILSGRYGWRTCLELDLTWWKKSSSAELNRSWTAGTSSLQYPSHLARRSSESRRTWSEAEHIPDQAGDAYWIRETAVARYMSCRDMDGVPFFRSTRIAYSRLELDDSNVVTWSAAVSLSLTITPRIRRVDTWSMSERGGGGARFRLAVKTILIWFLWCFRTLSRAETHQSSSINCKKINNYENIWISCIQC